MSKTNAFSNRPIPVRGDAPDTSIVDNDERDSTTQHQCQFCNSMYDSRNALFRHLKIDKKCAAEFRSLSDEALGKEVSPSHRNSSLRKMSLFLKICYTRQFQSSRSINSTFHWKTGRKNKSEAYEIGQKVQDSIASGLLELFEGPNSEGSQGQQWIIGTTQTSTTSNRPPILAQENGISSASDFLLLNLQVPQGELEESSEVDKLLSAATKYLDEGFETSSGVAYNVKILNGMRLPNGFVFHAEKECTQRVYHYLMPLSWLPDGALLESWCRNYDHQSKPAPPSDALAKLRDVLHLAESTAILNRKVRRKQSSDTNNSNSKSRKKKIRNGTVYLHRKERLPWHNFGHVELRGDASPNQEPVWNVLDRARIKGYLLPSGFDHTDETMIIVEFAGDNFVPGQIQSIVGTAVAVANGWLASDIFSMALSKDFLLETPTSPLNRLYCAGARFHSHESKLAAVIKNDGEEQQAHTFQVLEHNAPKTALQSTQEQVLRSLCSKSEKLWLEELEQSVAPRIRETMVQLKGQQSAGSGTSNVVAESLPTLEACVKEEWGTALRTAQDEAAVVQAYQRTLHLLRELIVTRSWPETSMARSNVIREEDTASSTIKSSDSKSTGQNGGSFTVFNPQVPNNPLLNVMGSTEQSQEKDVSQQSLPLGNEKFPELVDAVFDLERVLSESGMLQHRASLDGSLTERNQEESSRSPSLCCAINANASFLPHVDSGRGAGQSLSLIVGLGDYDNGGEIRVEDYSHDIRYKPLEFDGWSSRHWTQPYRGERFSLVWFSPAISIPKNERPNKA